MWAPFRDDGWDTEVVETTTDENVDRRTFEPRLVEDDDAAS